MSNLTPPILLQLNSLPAPSPAQTPEAQEIKFVKRSERAYTVKFICVCGYEFVDSFNKTPAVRLAHHRNNIKNKYVKTDYYAHLVRNNHNIASHQLLEEYAEHKPARFLHAQTKRYAARTVHNSPCSA